jgi:alcohol dehydrogenase
VDRLKNYYMPTRICSGAGALKQLSSFINENDRVCVISDKGLVKAGIVTQVLEVIQTQGSKAEVFDDVEANPRPDAVAKGLAKVKEMNASLIVGLGGGSPLDVAKVVSGLATNEGTLRQYQWEGKQMANPALPFIAIPTTAGTGSEVTRVAVIIDQDVKKGIVSDRLFPAVAIVDPNLMKSLPAQLTATTGMDALTHAIEAYVGLNANSFTDSYALEAIRLLAKYLPKAFANGENIYAREQVAKASTLAGIAMDQAGLGIVHALSSPLSSHYDVPHGLSNAVLLPYGMKFNLIAAPEKFAQITRCFGVDDAGLRLKEKAALAVKLVQELCEEINIPQKLSDYFQAPGDIERFGEEAAKTFLVRNNPRQVNPIDCETIFREVLLLQ